MTEKRRNRPESSPEMYGKVPPQAVELEEAVLGAAMLEQEGCESAVRLLQPDAFYKEQHRVIFEAIVSLYGDNQPVDLLTVTERLRKSGNLEIAGGPYEITMLTNRVASSANLEYHAAIILEKYLQRELIRVSSEILNEAYNDTSSVFELLDQADRNIQTIGEIASKGGESKHVGDLIRSSREELKHREEKVKAGKMTGITTGLTDLNQKTNGWQPCDLIIWASRPGMGKTATMLKMAKEAAKSGTPVCIYSLEMSGIRLTDRLILSCCNIDPDKFRSGWMTTEDWKEFDRAEKEIKTLPIYVDDNPVVSMRYIKSHARMMQRKGKCGMIMVDYLQLADMGSQSYGRNREQEVAQASREAKIIAKTLQVPFHLLAQLSRAVEKRGGDMHPILSDLRESGAIEQDADVVIFIHRPEYYGIDVDGEGNSTKGVGELIIAKNREGSLGIVVFRHNPSITKMWDYKPDISDGKIPPNENFYQSAMTLEQTQAPF